MILVTNQIGTTRKMDLPWKKAEERKVLVIIQEKDRLSEKDVALAFSGRKDTLWYRALKQICTDDMNASALSIALYSEKSNALGVAAAGNGYVAISGLLAKIEQLVQDQPDLA